MQRRHLAVLMLFFASALGPDATALAEQTPPPERAEDTRAVAVGTAAPDATVQTIEGEEIQLQSLLGEQPVALIFYRGGW